MEELPEVAVERLARPARLRERPGTAPAERPEMTDPANGTRRVRRAGYATLARKRAVRPTFLELSSFVPTADCSIAATGLVQFWSFTEPMKSRSLGGERAP